MVVVFFVVFFEELFESAFYMSVHAVLRQLRQSFVELIYGDLSVCQFFFEPVNVVKIQVFQQRLQCFYSRLNNFFLRSVQAIDV